MKNGKFGQLRGTSNIPKSILKRFPFFFNSHSNRKDKHTPALLTSAMGQKGMHHSILIPVWVFECCWWRVELAAALLKVAGFWMGHGIALEGAVLTWLALSEDKL